MSLYRIPFIRAKNDENYQNCSLVVAMVQNGAQNKRPDYGTVSDSFKWNVRNKTYRNISWFYNIKRIGKNN